MPKVALRLEYDGARFCGWELQRGQRSVRGELEKALHKIFQEKISVNAASRTDAGVHALCQVVDFKTRKPISLENIAKALNSVLPEDIQILKAVKGSKGQQRFKARYDAKSKEYEYLIYNGDQLPVHFRHLVWQVRPKLNVAAMKKAAKLLVGQHDFSSFCAAHSDDKNFVRNLQKLDIRHSKLRIWSGCQLPVVSCQFIGSGFLYKMVRNIVGTLVDVGLGKRTSLEVKRILESKDRRLAGRTAPAKGLCLMKISY
jgi:tRNA pseudouridine38-40 synthase